MQGHGHIGEDDIPPCHIRIDREGTWYYRGLPIIHPEIYRYLNQCLTRDSSGRYILSLDGERCYLEVEDTPYVIKEVSLKSTAREGPSLFIKLNEGSEEELKIDTLWVGEDNVLYCKVKDACYDARFLRASYYQFIQFLHHDGKNYYLILGESKIVLPQLCDVSSGGR